MNNTMFQCFKCGHSLLEGAECTCENANEDNPNVFDNVFYNHVLAYCQSALHSFNVDIVSKALDMYFSTEDIYTARKLLRQYFADKLAGLDIMKYDKRRDSKQRSGAMMEAQDLAEALHRLSGEDIPPRFVTFELHKLPILRPDSACEKSLAEKVALLEKKFERMEQWQEQKDEMTEEHDRRISVIEKRRNCQEIPCSMPVASSSAGSSQVQVSYSQAANIPQVTPRPQVPSMAEIIQSEIAKASTAPKPVPPVSAPKQQKGKQAFAGRKPLRIQGKSTCPNIKAGLGPDRDFWIYNVDRSMADADLRTFIENGGCTKKNKVVVRQLEPRYEEHWDSKRFHLTIPLSHYEDVFSEEFWPENIWLKKYWVNLKKKPEDVQGPSNGSNGT